MNLLAHTPDGTQALIQHHDNGQPYHYTFGDIDTYALVENPDEWMLPEGWVHDIDDPQFPTQAELREYLKGYVSGSGGESMWNLPPGVKWSDFYV